MKRSDSQRLEKIHVRLLCFGLTLITLLLYLPVRQDGLLPYDDPTYITNNRVVQNGLTWQGLRWAFTTFTASNWHPLTWISHMVDCQLFGPDAGAHHLVSVLWQAANAALLLLLYARLTGALWPSAFAAALLMWHPLRVESVAWAAERKDVLSVFFFLLTLLTYIRWATNATEPTREQAFKSKAAAQTSSASPRSNSRRFYLLMILFFALGLMSKPMLVTTPFVLLLLDFFPLRRFELSEPVVKLWRTAGTLVWEKAPLFLLSAACSVGTYLAQRNEAVVALTTYPFRFRLLNTLLGYGGYLWKTIWPFDLSIIYPFPQYVPWRALILSGIAVGLISSACWQTRRTRPHLLVGWLWFLGTLVPVIGLVQVGSAAMADRYTYIPQIGLFLALAMEIKRRCETPGCRQGPVALAGVAVLAGCLALTTHQLRYWRDGVSLFSHAIKVTGPNPLAKLNLALSLEIVGARDQALQNYQEALQLNPELYEAHNALGDLLNELGRTNEAIAQYTAELQLHQQPVTHENLGALLVKLGRIDEGMTHYAAAARLDPTDARAHYLMAKALLRRNRDAEAIAQFHQALQRDPEHLQSLVYLARVLAADEDPKNRNATEAIKLAERANALTAGSQPFMLDTLAIAYAEAGRFKEAEQTLGRALEQATGIEDANAVAAMQGRLKLYQAGKPYRESFSESAEGLNATPVK